MLQNYNLKKMELNTFYQTFHSIRDKYLSLSPANKFNHVSL